MPLHLPETQFIDYPLGYVGGSILLELLNHGHAGSSITALVRSSEKARKLEALNLGIKVTEGTPNDAALLVTLTREADVIIDAVRLVRLRNIPNLLIMKISTTAMIW